MLLLTAAEFALLPLYLMPQSLVLPLSNPMSVPGWAALAAVVKGSCSLARPYHPDQESLVTFPGDAQKLVQSEPGQRLLSPSYLQEPDWNDLSDDLQSQHRLAGTSIGHAIADSGVLKLQTLVWAAKWTTVVPGASTDIDSLARSLRVVS
jgi:hypothetical protein